MMRVLLLSVVLSLSACASTYQSRIEAKLVAMGLSHSKARCMAERLVDRLSEDQLRSLGRLAALQHRDVGKMSIEELIRRSAALGDPKIVAVVTRAGLGCAIRG
ncbi:MAG TPA: hypothetical protein VJ859_01545 [Allosphingosinicella sp.]|nr:hypothetical protein [Allosphingosinicella sp.]